MIDHEKTWYSVATGARKLVGHRMNGSLEGACAVIRVRHASSDQAGAAVGERWKASMTHACTPAPYVATQMMQAAWHVPGQLWVRPVRACRPGQSYDRRKGMRNRVHWVLGILMQLPFAVGWTAMGMDLLFLTAEFIMRRKVIALFLRKKAPALTSGLPTKIAAKEANDNG